MIISAICVKPPFACDTQAVFALSNFDFYPIGGGMCYNQWWNDIMKG